MDSSTPIQAVMTTFPHSIGVDQTLQVAKEMLREHGVRHLPVQRGGELLGVLTHRDIHFVLSVDKRQPSEMLVEDAYTQEPYIVDIDTPVRSVARRMAQDGLGCALVVQETRLVGIFTTVDACRCLAEVLEA